MAVNRRIVLARRPVGRPRPEDFRLEEVPVPRPGPGEVLVRNLWLSLDPYMRGRTGEGRSYARPVELGEVPVELGEVMVGGTVGQLARLAGARVVGIAGGPEKCRLAVERPGFPICLDHRAPDLPGRLRAACPDGIDVYWENVGGGVLEAVLPLLNDSSPACRSAASSPGTTRPSRRPARTGCRHSCASCSPAGCSSRASS